MVLSVPMGMFAMLACAFGCVATTALGTVVELLTLPPVVLTLVLGIGGLVLFLRGCGLRWRSSEEPSDPSGPEDR